MSKIGGASKQAQGPNSVSQGRNGPATKVATGNVMGGSEWDMLTMLSQQ